VREFDNIERVGRSSKTTLTDGAAMFDESTDDSPVELDGLGGNAGISTPYLPFGGNPPQQYPEYQQLGDESVMRINGQDVRATLDGVGIPFAFALHLLQNGSALPAALAQYQNNPNFNFTSYGLGIFTASRVVGWSAGNQNFAPNAQGFSNVIAFAEENHLSTIYRHISTFSFSFGAALSGFRQTKEDETIPPKKEPGGGGGKGESNATNEKGIAQDCIDAIKELGVWDKVQELLKNPPLINVDGFLGMEITNPLGSNKRKQTDFYSFDTPGSLGAGNAVTYFGSLALAGESIGQTFDRESAGSEALTIRGYGVDGIYYRSSRTDVKNYPYLLLHEVVHLAYPPAITRGAVDLDTALVNDLFIDRVKGKTDSQLVSDFFNQKCPTSLRFGNTKQGN
jgi:hypothetical protein